MTDQSFILEWFDEASKRSALFEDDGKCAWLYLTAPGQRKPIADIWVHNRIPAPPPSEIKNYRGGPPPAARGYTDDAKICIGSDRYQWTINWYGDYAVLHRDGIAIAMISGSSRRGWSKTLLRDGPWGNVWDEKLYVNLTQTGG